MEGLQELTLAQDEGAEAAPGGGAGTGMETLVTMAPILLMLAVFYLLVIRPQQNDQSKRQAELDRLKKDDEVVTIGGIIGTVANLSEDRKEITLKVSDNTRIRVLRSAVQTIVSQKADGGKTPG